MDEDNGLFWDRDIQFLLKPAILSLFVASDCLFHPASATLEKPFGNASSLVV